MNHTTTLILKQVPNSTIRTVLHDVYGYFQSADAPEDRTLALLLRRIGALLQRLDQILGLENKSPFTEAKRKADAKRDDLLVGLLFQIEAASRHFEERRHAPAELLLQLLAKRVPSLQVQAYDVNTAELVLLFQDCDKPDAQEALAALELTGWYQHLKQANQEFEALVKEQNATEATLQPLSLSDTKNRLARDFRLLLQIGAMHSEEGDPAWTERMQRSDERLPDLRPRRETPEPEQQPAPATAGAVGNQ